MFRDSIEFQLDALIIKIYIFGTGSESFAGWQSRYCLDPHSPLIGVCESNLANVFTLWGMETPSPTGLQVDAAPPSLLSQLLMLLQRAEMDVSDGLNKPRSSEALNLKKILSSISMIFGNATAISAAFGTASGACIDVEQLDIINMRILDLYKASNKECSAAMAHHPVREKLQQLEAGVRDEMKRSHTKLADDIQKNVKLLGTNERAQVLLVRTHCASDSAGQQFSFWI